MKAKELVELDADELAAKLAEAKEELFNLRFQNVTGQLDNPHRLREVRKDIARILTVMGQRELAGDEPPAAVAVRAPAKRRLGRRAGA
ncbi:MAG TPA: 50S ribosomal protein L29 [Actinomycetes bacterium]|jgi:large subunit ribosomal protein L29|nr:50S ribosomal protein L29 [Actinomycetes bacterium]